MGEPSTFRPWNRPATEEELVAERRRERVRSWVRPSSVGVAIAVAALDAVVVLVASGIQTAVRVRTGRPCATFWTVLAHDTLTGVWVVLGLVGVTLVLALAMRRRWVFIAVLVVQLGAVAILVPNLVHKHDEYLAVAEGTKSPVEVDTGGVACS